MTAAPLTIARPECRFALAGFGSSDSGNGLNVRTMRTRFAPGRKGGEPQQENGLGLDRGMRSQGCARLLRRGRRARIGRIRIVEWAGVPLADGVVPVRAAQPLEARPGQRRWLRAGREVRQKPPFYAGGRVCCSLPDPLECLVSRKELCGSEGRGGRQVWV
jgi:hypothetical protein